MLDGEQKNLINTISGIFEISKQQIDELKKEVHELRHSLEHSENLLEHKAAWVEQNLGHIESCVQEMNDYQLDPALRVDEIKERPNERWVDCENELNTLFK